MPPPFLDKLLFYSVISSYHVKGELDKTKKTHTVLVSGEKGFRLVVGLFQQVIGLFHQVEELYCFCESWMGTVLLGGACLTWSLQAEILASQCLWDFEKIFCIRRGELYQGP